MLEKEEYIRCQKAGGLTDEEAERQWQMRLLREYEHEWHSAINRHALPFVGENWPCFMYDAKTASQEIRRLPALFKSEREGTLPKSYRRCSHSASAPQDVPDNHLFCCLGVKCKDCPYLLALDDANMPSEQTDQAKAWTCVSHILSKGGDVAGEGYILTIEDRMYWDSLYESLAESANLRFEADACEKHCGKKDAQ